MDTTTQASIEFYDTLWSATTRVDQHHKCRGRSIENILRALPEPAGRRRTILERHHFRPARALRRRGRARSIARRRRGGACERQGAVRDRHPARHRDQRSRLRRVRAHPSDRALQRRDPGHPARERPQRRALGRSPHPHDPEPTGVRADAFRQGRAPADRELARYPGPPRPARQDRLAGAANELCLQFHARPREPATGVPRRALSRVRRARPPRRAGLRG